MSETADITAEQFIDILRRRHSKPPVSSMTIQHNGNAHINDLV